MNENKSINCKSCGELVRKVEMDDIVRHLQEGRLFSEKCPKCDKMFKVEPILSFKFWEEKK